MEIISSTPEAIGVTLDFMKPFKSLGNRLHFGFDPAGEATRVTWRMQGRTSGLMSVLGRFMKMDRLVGRDFEKGLARLKAVAEKSGHAG